MFIDFNYYKLSKNIWCCYIIFVENNKIKMTIPKILFLIFVFIIFLIF